jgi:hypothetical protein
MRISDEAAVAARAASSELDIGPTNCPSGSISNARVDPDVRPAVTRAGTDRGVPNRTPEPLLVTCTTAIWPEDAIGT